MFARKGFDAAQTPEIAAEAGVSTGAFYRYFTDKREVFVEVVANHLRQSQEEVMARLHARALRGRRQIGARQAARHRPGHRRALRSHQARRRARAGLFVDVLFAIRKCGSYARSTRHEGCQTLTKLIEVIVPREVMPDAAAAARVIGITAVEIAADRAGLRPHVGQRWQRRRRSRRRCARCCTATCSARQRLHPRAVSVEHADGVDERRHEVCTARPSSSRRSG